MAKPDITGLEQAEKDLKDSEERFKIIAEIAPMPISLTKVSDGTVLFANNAYLQMVGAGGQDIAGMKATEFYETQGDRSDVLGIIKEKGALKDHEVRIKKKDGTFIWVSASLNPVEYEGEQAFLGAYMDITERKQTEKELARGKNELQTIIDSVPASIFYKDKENRFLRVNRAFCEMMGMPREKLEGVRLSGIYPAEQAEACLRDDMKVIESGRPQFGIIEQVQTKKGMIWAQTDKLPYYDEAGKVIGIIGFAVDITARRSSEENLKKYNRMLWAISNTNQSLMRAENKRDFINEVCRIVINDCGYRLAWIGYAKGDGKNPSYPKPRPVMRKAILIH